MPSPILARADALMLRRRQGENAALDDVPVLTDAVDTPHTTTEERTTPWAENAASAALIAAISDRVLDHLAAQLPRLIAEALHSTNTDGDQAPTP